MAQRVALVSSSTFIATYSYTILHRLLVQIKELVLRLYGSYAKDLKEKSFSQVQLLRTNLCTQL